MKTISYLIFEGKAEEAIEFYTNAFNGKVNYVMKGKEAQGMDVKLEDKDKILHGEVKIAEDCVLYLSDTFSDEKIIKGNNYSITLACDSEEQIETLYEKLSEGGKVMMPLEDTFWNAKHGSLIDKYGVNWNLNYSYEQQ